MINLILGQMNPSGGFLIEDVDSLLTVDSDLILVPGFIGVKLRYTNRHIVVLCKQDLVSLIIFFLICFIIKIVFPF